MHRASFRSSEEGPLLPQKPPKADLKISSRNDRVCGQPRKSDYQSGFYLFRKLTAPYCPNVVFPRVLMKSQFKKKLNDWLISHGHVNFANRRLGKVVLENRSNQRREVIVSQGGRVLLLILDCVMLVVL